jgi:hypothetical protein
MMHTNGHHSSESGFPSLVEGVVEAANPKGVRVRGEWFNASQFKPVALPEVGEYVRLNVDAKRFISAVEVVKPAHDDTAATPAVLSRETRIARLAVLKAAAAFGASRPDLKSSDVLRIADAWLAWVEAD